MNAYLSVEGGNDEIPLERKAEVYRDPEGGREIVVETPDRTVQLGISDVTVSRKKGTEAPVVIEPRSEHIEIRNQGNSNGLTISDGDQDVEIAEGFLKRVRRDTRLKIGYQTVLQLKVEREAREEYVIQGDVTSDGDVIMGDSKRIDQSTTVEDSVVNRSDIGGEGGADVNDSTVNRSNVGGSGDSPPGQSNPDGGSQTTSDDTQQFCNEHNVAYSGSCPKCEQEASADPAPETKYCIHCGDEIPAVAAVCPNCGEEQADL